MSHTLTRTERIALGPGGFHGAHNMRRNNPRTRFAFDAWLDSTRADRDRADNREQSQWTT